MNDDFDKLGIVMIGIGLTVVTAVWGTIGYVAWHFISKWW